MSKGKPDKSQKIKKPDYMPIEPPVGQSSLYARQFKNMAINKVEESLLIGVGCRNVSLMTILMCIIPEMRRMRCLLYY